MYFSVSHTMSFLLLLLFSVIGTYTTQALVPKSQTFKLVNEGEFGEYYVEYGPNYRALDVFENPFQLCFYNTTPNQYTLALRMGTRRSETLMRWVWEANRGNPVGEGAYFELRRDGNLVLAEADGRIAWQTNTANKGVVGFKLLPNGNMVLYDNKGKFIWQSFDSPTDTLLVGQSLRRGGPYKLVSRDSEKHNRDGRYSLVFEKDESLTLYYRGPNSPTPYVYYIQPSPMSSPDPIDKVTFEPFELSFSTAKGIASSVVYRKPKYNSTLSYLRLGMDGNIRIHTYEIDVYEAAWEQTYEFFSDSNDEYGVESECQLPEKCGRFGLCESDQCVACPLPTGLMGWSKECRAPKLNSCKDFRYYKLEGVDHFMVKYTKGLPMRQSLCEAKCSNECKCLGYFYDEKRMKCWIAYDLQTMKRSPYKNHVAYIKAPKK